MSMNRVLAQLEAKSLRADKLEFEVGDTVDVHVRILEGEKERIQIFSGIVIGRRGDGTRECFTVRRIVEGEGVERVFPYHSPKIAEVIVKRKSKVRRAKLYFLRDRVGKEAYRLKERPMNAPTLTGDEKKKQARKGRKAKEAVAPVAADTSAKVAAAKKDKRRAARAKKKETT